MCVASGIALILVALGSPTKSPLICSVVVSLVGPLVYIMIRMKRLRDREHGFANMHRDDTYFSCVVGNRARFPLLPCCPRIWKRNLKQTATTTTTIIRSTMEHCCD
uniref:Secreted protein n=1 Tax=Anopheles darlingi TaxID=43151 RepID=A0A2M4DC11_ANODA